MRTPLDFRPCRTFEEAALQRDATLLTPAWANANRIKNDHDLEVARIEREGAERAAGIGRP